MGRLLTLPRRLRRSLAGGTARDAAASGGRDPGNPGSAESAWAGSAWAESGLAESGWADPTRADPAFRDPALDAPFASAGPPGAPPGRPPGRASETFPREPADGDSTAGNAFDGGGFDWRTFETVVASAPDLADTVADTRGPPAVEAARGEGWLEVHDIKKSFKSRLVVKGVSLGVRRGEVVGLLGPNGAGKTTVFYMITGLITADSGAITFDGRGITRLPMYRRARLGIGYLPQEPSIFRGLTVEQNILAVLEVTEPNRKKRREELDSLLEEFAITRLRKSPAIALSGGERRRVEIARALASRPAFMLLDEPFAGIDPIAVGDIRALVRHLSARGIGVLITDHNVRETLGLIDRAYIIHDGQVLMQGSPEEVVANEDVRRFYLGDEFRM